MAYSFMSLISNVLKDLYRWAGGRSKKRSPEEVARLRQKWKEEIESHLRGVDGRVGYREALIRDVKRIHAYPYTGGKRKGISPWFKVDLLGTYDRGLQVGLKIVGLKYEQREKAWRFCNYSGGESSDINAYLVGLIPFERIVSINWEGDEYDNTPHIYCSFTSKKKEPYEEIIICERRHLDQHEHYSEIAKYEQVRKLSKRKGDTGGEFENERKAGFPQGADALKSGDFLSPLMQLICCQPHRGEFATSIKGYNTY